MQLWLNEPGNIEKLLSVKTDLREATKRRHGLDSSSDRSSPLDMLGRLSRVSRISVSRDMSHVSRVQSYVTRVSDDYSNPASEPGLASATKKARVTLSEEQREALNIAFFLDPYPGTQAVEYLAMELGLEARTINNWFHNHRYEE